MAMGVDEPGQKDGVPEVDVTAVWRMTSRADIRDATGIDGDGAVRDGGRTDRQDVASVIANHVRRVRSRVCARVEKAGARAVSERIVERVLRDADGARHGQWMRDVRYLGLGVAIGTKRDAYAGRPGTPNESLVRPVTVRDLEGDTRAGESADRTFL